MMLFFPILISFLLGFLFCIFIFRKDGHFNFRFLINLALPLGIGFSSVIFISLNLLGLPFLLIFLVEIGLIVFLVFKIKNLNKLIRPSIWFNFNKPECLIPYPLKKQNKNVFEHLKRVFNHLDLLFQNPILFFFSAVYFYAWLMDFGIFYFDSIKEPHGLWDAFNYWNLKAKLISRAPGDWPLLFHQMISDDFHPDYPLLQTGYVARCWLFMKNESVWGPIVVSSIFTFCTIGLLASSVRILTNKINGLIAGLILLATPFYMTMGDSQYADNTVGFFYLATVVLLTFARKEPSNKPLLFIATGIMAGLSAWSKNEGLLFIACLFCSQIFLLFFKNYRELFMELKYLFLGMLPVLILIAYHKIAIAPPNDIVSAQGMQTLVKIGDYSRYKTIFKWWLEQFKTFGKWVLNPWWLFLFGILYKGIDFKKNRNNLISFLILLILMLMGFFFIYIISPLDLEFHLSTSLHRLFFQLFPTFIFIYFLALQKSNIIQIHYYAK